MELGDPVIGDTVLGDFDLGGRGIVRPAVGPLGRALRQARLERYLSQAQLAKRAGVHQTRVSKLELGVPNWSLFCRLVDALGAEPVVTVATVPDDLRALRQLAETAW